MSWLTDEMHAAAERVRLPHIERIVACGVPLSAIAHLGQSQHQFGMAKVRELPGGLYEPDPDGSPSVILPVVEQEVFEPFEGFPIVSGTIVDLVAFQTSNPAAWRWRTGEGWALGTHLLDGDEPVDVVRTPLEWLACAGEALAVLNWSAPADRWRAVREGPPLIAPDNTTRRRLQNAVARSIPLPLVEVRHAA
jgi:hypothetical protein